MNNKISAIKYMLECRIEDGNSSNSNSRRAEPLKHSVRKRRRRKKNTERKYERKMNRMEVVRYGNGEKKEPFMCHHIIILIFFFMALNLVLPPFAPSASLMSFVIYTPAIHIHNIHIVMLFARL